MFKNTIVMKTKLLVSLLFISTVGITAAQAQRTREPRQFPYSNRLTVLGGLSQPLFFRGGNVAATYFFNRFTLEYSQGIDLDYTGSFLRGDDRDFAQIKSRYTGGIGLGYRVTKNLDLRVEPYKYSGYNVKLQTSEGVKELNYATWTVGGGAYYRIYLWKGLLIEPSVRYWPEVSTTLEGGEYRYNDPQGVARVHKNVVPGFFGNVSVGWTFGRDK